MNETQEFVRAVGWVLLRIGLLVGFWVVVIILINTYSTLPKLNAAYKAIYDEGWKKGYQYEMVTSPFTHKCPSGWAIDFIDDKATLGVFYCTHEKNVGTEKLIDWVKTFDWKQLETEQGQVHYPDVGPTMIYSQIEYRP